MTLGFILLVVLAVVGVNHAMNLPDEISKSLWVFRHDPSTQSYGACVGRVHAAGLRGAFLAWTDGLLQAWGTVYLGPDT